MIYPEPLTREEMGNLLNKGVCPLEVSIIKWQRIVDALKNGVSVDAVHDVYEDGSYNCALCDTSERDCRDCPICLRTGKSDCEGSPYFNFCDARDPFDDLGDQREASLLYAEKMLDLLKELRVPPELKLADSMFRFALKYATPSEKQE